MTEVRLTHVGGPTTLLEVEGWRILTDPTFDPPGRRYSFGWGTSSRKVHGPAVEPDGIGRVDAVLLTHDHHADNLDDAGRALLATAGTVVTTRSGAKRLGRGARGLRPWERTTLERAGLPAITVTATPCRHGPPGSRPVAGEVIGFALAWEGQEHGAFWVLGDTVLHRGVKAVPERIDVGTVLLHLGAVRFPITGPIRYSMTARDALELCALAAPRTAIPVHYEGWSHFTEGRDGIERELADAPSPLREAFLWLPPGTPTPVSV